MKEFVTPSVPKTASIKYLSDIVPMTQFEKDRVLFVFPICPEVARAIEALRNPDTTVNLKKFLESLTQVKELMFSALMSRKEKKNG